MIENRITITKAKTAGYSSFLIVSIMSIVAAFFVYYPITDTDIWWHLSAAREMLAQKQLLFSDPFSYSLNNIEWINLHWFYQLFSFGIYSIAGYGGLVLIKCAAIAGVSVIVSNAFPFKRSMIIASLFFSLLIFEARYFICVRPIIVTLICIALYIFLIERFIQKQTMVFLILLLPIQIIWTNSQGLYLLGPIITACYLVGEYIQKLLPFLQKDAPVKTKSLSTHPFKLAAFSFLLIPVCFINPYGWKGILLPLKLLGRIDPSITNVYSRTISENIPLFTLSGNDVHYFYTVIIATIIVLFSFWINRNTFRWSHFILFSLFLCLTIMAIRNITLYFTIIPVITGYNFFFGYKSYNTKNQHGFQSLNVYHWIERGILSTGFILLSLCVLYHTTIISKYPKKSFISPFIVPSDAVDYLKTHKVEGNLFNSMRYGGYLIWRFYPEKKVFIDTRLILRSSQFYKEYLSLLNNPDSFPSIIERFGITHVILQTAIFYLDMPLVKWLYKSPSWDLVFADGSTVVFVKISHNKFEKLHFEIKANIDRVKMYINNRWKDDAYIRKEALLYFDAMLKYCNS